MTFGSGRKHRLDADTGVRGSKRIRLDTLMERLLLDAEERPRKLRINPLVEIDTPLGRVKSTTRVDDLIGEKMAQAYKDHILQGYVLIKYTHPLTQIVRHFQQWVKRHFNTFVHKFNESNPHREQVPKFRTFRKIWALVECQPARLSYQELMEIVTRESAIEVGFLKMKQDRRLDYEKLQEIKDEEQLAKECSYKYWDRMPGISADVEMEVNLESDMEIEEANYGTYYTEMG